MKSFPIIGDIAHVFEILVPGMFLLLNFIGAIYFFPLNVTTSQRDELLKLFTTDPVVSLLLVISFGYLLGILLRLMRCTISDKFSGMFLHFTERRKHQKGVSLKNQLSGDSITTSLPLLSECKFPYTEYLGLICKTHYTPDALYFYKRVWSLKNRNDSHFFNFCKTLVTLEDVKAGLEIQYAESLSRYISSMFYAIVIAVVIDFIPLVFAFASGALSGTIAFY